MRPKGLGGIRGREREGLNNLYLKGELQFTWVVLLNPNQGVEVLCRVEAFSYLSYFMFNLETLLGKASKPPVTESVR